MRAWHWKVGCIAAAMATGCDGGGGIAFHGEETFLESLNQDTGFVPSGSPAQVRVVASGGGSVTVDARGTSDGSTLEPTPGSGRLAAEGSLGFEVSVRVVGGLVAA